MNAIGHIRRVAGVLAGLACALLGLAVAAPAAFAVGPPPPVRPAGYIIPSTEPSVPVHTAVISGMPGWQVALIALGAALAAATATALVDRAWAARCKPVTAAA
jgi:Na+/proline symporter